MRRCIVLVLYIRYGSSFAVVFEQENNPVADGSPFVRLFACFFTPFIILGLLFLSLLVVTRIRGHIAGSSPPPPTTVRALHFHREKISALSSFVDSRRIVLYFFFFFLNHLFVKSPFNFF